jgi:hypothetical protein
MKSFGTSLIVLLTAAGQSSCVTTSDKREFEASKVVERMGDGDETPEWTLGDQAMNEESGDVVFVNVVSMSGDSRPEACTKAASLEAKAEMLKHIKESITSSGQLSEDSAQSDPAFEALTAFLSQGELNGARIADRYWERREESSADGERVLRLRCAAKVSIPKTTLARMLRDATTKVKSGNPEIREKLLEAQKEFIDSVGKQAH